MNNEWLFRKKKEGLHGFIDGIIDLIAQALSTVYFVTGDWTKAWDVQVAAMELETNIDRDLLALQNWFNVSVGLIGSSLTLVVFMFVGKLFGNMGLYTLPFSR